MNLKIVENPHSEVGTALIMLAPADYVAYKEYLSKRKELEEGLGVINRVTSLIEDAFFVAEVESKNKT